MSEQKQTLTIQQAIDLGVQHHNAGDLTKAEGIYQQILQADPNQPVAMHMLGVVAYQVGKNDVAVALITKALAIKPDLGEAHSNLGLALHGLDRLEEAATSYHTALSLKPDYAEAHSNLGAALRELGKPDDAVTSCRKALGLKPDFTEAHSNLGAALQDLGKLDEAVQSYHRALAIKPDHADANYNLGNVLQELGKLEEAVASYRKALDLKPDNAKAHNDLGNALQELGKQEEAVTSYRKALGLKPDHAEAHNNLGAALQELGKLDEAVASYRKALALNPNFADAHNNLGAALQDFGKPDDAVASYRKALALKPDFPKAHSNLGAALHELGKSEDAIASYHKALALNPNIAEAHNNLGYALQDLGKREEAFACQRRAVSINSQNDSFWAELASSLETLSFASIDDNLYQDLLHMLERPTVHPSYVIRPIISALRHCPDFSRIVELTGSGKPEIGFNYGDVAEQLSAIPLFVRMLELNPIYDLDIERMLTFLRHAMIEEATASKMKEKCLPFSVALALQCFANEYVFSETEEEKEAVEKLEQKIALLAKKGHPVPPSFVVALGTYRPLFSFPWAQKLSEQKWTDSIKSVFKRQISEPMEEPSLRDQIPCVTSIQNSISKSVREQYEENPYPRWIKSGLAYKSKSIGAVLRGSPLRFDLGDYVSPESPEILVAGCGTGQHSLFTASRFSNARVLAVDLSMNSLSYALRKTNELGFSNIEYVQADIMELGGLGRQFDLIECAGVLHHLGDPLAGWHVLVDLLRPGGLMQISLYSEIARQGILRGRSLIAEKGYSTSPEDIRRCRQDFITMAEDGNPTMAKIWKYRDFFSLSECRDLLFHVQEHRFTLPQIEAALKLLNLKFLGFEIRDQKALKQFKEFHPNSNALTSLSLWHDFELENPDTFIGMYQFWCQKS